MQSSFSGLIKVHSMAEGNKLEDNLEAIHAPSHFEIDFPSDCVAVLFSVSG